MSKTISAGKYGEWASRVDSVADRLGFAASPTFALMAWSVTRGTHSGALGTSMQEHMPIDGMPWMYLLMCLFHIPPWLRLFLVRADPLTHPASPVEGDRSCSIR